MYALNIIIILLSCAIRLVLGDGNFWSSESESLEMDNFDIDLKQLQIPYPRITYNHSCTRDHDCSENEFCDVFTYLCKCEMNSKFNEDFQRCIKCPGFGERCFTQCCNRNDLHCVNGRCVCVDDFGRYQLCSISKNGVFMTASQIALSAALIMAIGALIMVLYRLCTRTRQTSVSESLTITGVLGPNNSNNGVTRSGNTLRESLTSMQIRILSRLRDRPPAYDQNESNSSRRTNTAPSQTQVATIPTITILEAPPPYESDRGQPISVLPPPYSEIIVNPSNLTTENQSSTTIRGTEDKTSPNDKDQKLEINIKRNS